MQQQQQQQQQHLTCCSMRGHASMYSNPHQLAVGKLDILVLEVTYLVPALRGACGMGAF
jgi:hypothetical protein